MAVIPERYGTAESTQAPRQVVRQNANGKVLVMAGSIHAESRTNAGRHPAGIHPEVAGRIQAAQAVRSMQDPGTQQAETCAAAGRW